MTNVLKSTVLIALAALVLTGCKPFEQKWEKETAYQQNYVPMIGTWEGTWTSNQTGHTGKLRAIVRRVDDNSYHAWFLASYADHLDFDYPFYLYTSYESRELVKFRGHANLNERAGGMHYYEGESTGTTFIINYKSKTDDGVFEMTRP